MLERAFGDMNTQKIIQYNNEDVLLHKQFVGPLASRQNWAGLVRYWIAMDRASSEASHRFMEILRMHEQLESRWGVVIDFLSLFSAGTSPLELPSPRALPKLSGEELSTLKVLVIYSRWLAQSLKSGSYQVNKNDSPYIKELIEISRGLGDEVLEAHAHRLLGLSLFEEGLPSSEAVTAGESAARIYGNLYARVPDLFRTLLAFQLKELSLFLEKCLILEKSIKAIEEAAMHAKILCDARPEYYQEYFLEYSNRHGRLLKKIGAFDQALKVFEANSHFVAQVCRSQHWIKQATIGETFTGLGVSLLDQGDAKRALESFEKAASIFENLHQGAPEEMNGWLAISYNNLGAAHKSLFNLQESAECFRKALNVLSLRTIEHAEEESDVVVARHNLGALLYEMNDFEGAERTFVLALESVRILYDNNPQEYRALLAMVTTGLGNVYRDVENLEGAKEAFEVALRQFELLADESPDVYNLHVAIALNNVSLAYTDLGKYSKALSSCKRAIGIRRELAARRPSVHLQSLALSLNNLGFVYLNRKQLSRAKQSFTSSLRIFESLNVEHQGAYSARIANLYYNIGCLEADRKRVQDAITNLEAACEYFAISEERNPLGNLIVRQRCYEHLGNLYRKRRSRSRLQSLELAYTAFKIGVGLQEVSRYNFASLQERRRIQAKAITAYDGAIESCLDLYDKTNDQQLLREAMVLAEASRSRVLTDLLAEEVLLPKDIPSTLSDRFFTIRSRISEVLGALDDLAFDFAKETIKGVGQNPGALVRHGSVDAPLGIDEVWKERMAESRVQRLNDELEELGRDYKGILKEIRVHDPEYDPAQPIGPISWADVSSLVPEDVPSAIVQFYVSKSGAFAFILTKQRLSYVRLPNLSRNQLIRLARRWHGCYYEEPERFDRWGLPSKLIAEICRSAIMPVLGVLEEDKESGGIERLIISPHQALHMFPFAACLINKKRGGDEEFLIDRFEICQVPSLSLLKRCQARRRPNRSPILVIGNPNAGSDILFSAREAKGIVGHYGGEVEVILRLGKASNKAEVVPLAKRVAQFLYCGHSYFNPERPLSSALILVDENDRECWLSLREIFREMQLPECSEVVLNGCESGMLKPEVADDYVSFPTAFLFRGSKRVVSTLWSVHDLSAALLMDKYHEIMGAGDVHSSAALRIAQQWMRKEIKTNDHLRSEIWSRLLKDGGGAEKKKGEEVAEAFLKRRDALSPLSSPLYWAAFFVSGVGYPALTRGLDGHADPESYSFPWEFAARDMDNYVEPVGIAEIELVEEDGITYRKTTRLSDGQVTLERVSDVNEGGDGGNK